MKKNIIAIVALIIISVSIYMYVQYTKALKYCWKINAGLTKIFSMGIKMVKMDLALDFKNSSDIDLSVYGYTFDISLNGIKVATVKNTDKQLIKANSFSVFNLGIEFSPEQAFKDNKTKLVELSSAFLANKKNILFSISGEVTAGILGMKVEKVPVSMNLSLAELLAPSVNQQQKCK